MIAECLSHGMGSQVIKAEVYPGFMYYPVSILTAFGFVPYPGAGYKVFIILLILAVGFFSLLLLVFFLEGIIADK